jgi:hypothetical protein
VDFRPIYAALAQRLQDDLGGAVKAVTRQNLPAGAFPEQPALVVLEYGLTPSDDDTYPVLWEELSALLVLHTRTVGDDAAPGDQVLDLISKIDGALKWRTGEAHSDGNGRWTTLGGLVLRARLGAVSIEDDLYDPQQVSTKIRVLMRALDK